MSRTNYEAVADFAGHWLHRAQVSLLTGKIGQIKLSHIRKNPGAGLVRASLARSPADCDTCGNLRRRGVGVFDTPTSGDACEGVCQTHQPPNHRGNFSERPERHEGPVRARCESTTPLRYEFV